LRHLANSTLRHDLKQLIVTDRGTTAQLVAHIAEFQSRKLYLEDGYGSMFDYCVRELGMSEDVACRRIRAARAALRFPMIFHALADGRIHLTGISKLAPHLTTENAEELLRAAFHKTVNEIELLITQRFPKPDLPTVIAALGAAHGAAVSSQPDPSIPALIPQVVENASALARIDGPAVVSSAPARMDVPAPRPVTPLAPGRYGWQLTVGQETQDLLQDVQNLLGSDVPRADLEAVLEYSLLAAKEKLLKRKCAATDQPRPTRPRNPDSRSIPAEVQRAVWKRDGGRCAFVSDTGHRCTERQDLQYDHIDPYGRDGASSVSNIRLLCRAHNQFEAEQTYGAEFMRQKREQGRVREDPDRAT
jgi:hypothetical protein